MAEALPAPLPEPLAEVRGFPSATGPVDLDVRPGDVLLLRGANGCGKTSLLRSLAGLGAAVAPADVRVGGQGPAALPANELARRLHFAMQEPSETLTGLTVDGEFRLRGASLPPELSDFAQRDVATLSSGEARRVGLAVVLAKPAPLLLLDEPAEGLDAAARDALLSLVRAHARVGAVVAADHSGLLAAVATRTVELRPSAAAGLTSLPPAPPGQVLASSATTADRSGRPVVLPEVRLGPGFHVVRGPNASGKSTLLLHLAGLLGPGSTVAGAAARPGENVRLALARAADLFTQETVAAELRLVPDREWEGLVASALLERHPLSLSAGEAQRVALTKALGRPAPVVLLDEPEAHLDDAGRAALVVTIARRVAEGACVLAATHDSALHSLAHSTIWMGRA